MQISDRNGFLCLDGDEFNAGVKKDRTFVLELFRNIQQVISK